MSYEYSEYKFPSRDGINTLQGHIYVPKDREPRGIIQLSHGMVDHVQRYAHVAKFFTENGYIFAGNDHLGHGLSVDAEDDYGYFATKDGVDTVLRDLHSFNKHLRELYPDVPLILMGHSMGSFLARLYAVKYPHTVSGVIIMGTAGKNSLVGMGKLLAKAIKTLYGERHRSKLLKSLSTGAYAKHFSKSEGSRAWLTRDASMVSADLEDPRTNFTFTSSAYIDLFTMLQKCNSKESFNAYPKEMPTIIMSGDCDPVGDFGKGVNYVYKQLLLAGGTNIRLKIYEGARHELFNEIGYEEVFADMLAFAERIK